MSDTVPTILPATTIASRAVFGISRLRARLKDTLSKTAQACTQKRVHDHHPDATFHDAGLSRDDALGIGSYHPELPFFMQSGFGRR